MKISTPTRLVAMACLLLTATTSAKAQQADTDTTVVVPQTGVLPIKPSRNFTGPSSVIVCSLFGSKNTALYFTKYRLDTVVVSSSANSSSGLFLVAQPGTYTLRLTDADVTGRINSTSVSWQAEPGTANQNDAGQAKLKNRRLFKFVNTEGHVGFERDEKYAADNYQFCDMAEGEHVYLPLNETHVAKAAELLGTTLEALSFMPWDGPWQNVPTPAEAAAGISASAVLPAQQAGGATYDLLGRQQPARQQGIRPTGTALRITGGKKYLTK